MRSSEVTAVEVTVAQCIQGCCGCRIVLRIGSKLQRFFDILSAFVLPAYGRQSTPVLRQREHRLISSIAELSVSIHSFLLRLEGRIVAPLRGEEGTHVCRLEGDSTSVSLGTL